MELALSNSTDGSYQFLPGRSGGWWYVNGQAVVVAASLLVIGEVPASFLGRYRLLYAMTLLAIGITLSSTGYWMIIHGARKCSCEVSRGYTTDARRARRDPQLAYFHHATMQLLAGPNDPRTGNVRLFGKPFVVPETNDKDTS